jgi:nucleotide-binding universal stress UspA family protein
MYRKILAPLDGSKEAEEVLNLIRGEAAPDATIVLLQVIPPARTQKAAAILFWSASRKRQTAMKLWATSKPLPGSKEATPADGAVRW